MAREGGDESAAAARRPLARQAREGTSAPDEPLPELFSPAFYEQVNKGPLEERYEERNKDPKNWTPIPWRLLLVGVLLGLVFTVVNTYAVLSVGILVAGSWYLIFFVGATLGWRPGVINYVGGASTGASQVVIAIAFVLPAVFMLATTAAGTGYYDLDAVGSPFALVGFFLVGALLGVLFFQVYRRLWIVDRPLHYPGAFDAAGELLRLAQGRVTRAGHRVREHVFVVTAAALLTGLWVVLRDLAIFGRPGERRAFLDELIGGRAYSEGTVPAPGSYPALYFGLFSLQPFLLAVGWFVRSRIALVLLAGGLLTFLLPFFSPAVYRGELPLPFELIFAWRDHARLLAAAAIVGAATVALVRLAPYVTRGLGDLFSSRDALTAARPGRFVALVLVLTALAMLFFVIAGVPLWGVLMVVPVAVLLVAVLGFAAVKVAGETSIQAISPLVVIGLLGFLFLLGLTGGSTAAVIVLALGAAAFLGTGIIMSTDVFLDTKVGHYVGNPPHRQAIAQLAGLVPGVALGTFVVWWFSQGIVADRIALDAPVAAIYSELVELVLGLSGQEFPWLLLLLAFLLGASVEYATRLGTAFGIGMALPLTMPVTILMGALLREGYERFVVRGEASERTSLMRLAVPVGVFIGASLTAVLVFGGNMFVELGDG